MATKILRLKLIQNLATNDIITYRIWKSNGTTITYGNGIQIPTLRAYTTNSAINNFQIGNSITQTMQNLYNAFINYNYSYIGLSYSFDGVDEITIAITNADGFEHRINRINVPVGKMLVLAENECDNVYIYNENLLNNFTGPIQMYKDNVLYFNGNHPTGFDAEVTRNANYSVDINGYNLNIPIPSELNNGAISHQMLPTLTALINITPFDYFNYTNYYFRFAGNTNSDRLIEGLLPDTINYINIIDKWGCETVYQIKTGIVDLGFLLQPQKVTPVYNPVLYKFGLSNYSEPGFRYYLNVVDEINSNTIANFTVVPDIDGTGYIDLSKHLSNLTTYDFTQQLVTEDCDNSYVKYQVNLGYELNEYWSYTEIEPHTISGTNYTRLVQGDNVTIPNFSVGDKVNISTANGQTQPINGLHTVKAVSGYSITVDVVYPIISGSTLIGGTVKFADNRKTRYENLYSVTDKFVWNGAMDWNTYKNFEYGEYLIQLDYPVDKVNLLTSLKPYNPGYEIYATEFQDFWFNLFVDTPYKKYAVEVQSNLGDIVYIDLFLGGENGYVKQFMINFKNLFALGIDTASSYIDFWIVNVDNNERLTNMYRLYLDRRCLIEEHTILYLDRFGSFQSFAFQLRNYEKGTIKRDEYNKQIDWFRLYNDSEDAPRQSSNQTFDLTDAGRTLWNVEVKKELTLNTNWMNDEMSVLFEELLTSPATFIKLNDSYVPCIVKETSFDVTRQKNKKLIKKEVTVTYSNDNPINI